MLDIYIDADGCAVKDETYRVAERYKLRVFVVANKPLNVPFDSRIQMETVSGDFDAADDWIVEHASVGDIVITSDILLGQRCVKKGVRAMGAKGGEFTPDNIGDAVATRELMTHLRQTGESRGGPAPMTKSDRSAFLGKLDQIIQAVKRTKS